MKKQQVISRFFSSKPISSASLQNASVSREKSASPEQHRLGPSPPKVEWPPRRRDSRPESAPTSSSTQLKKRRIDGVRDLSGSEVGGANSELPPRKKLSGTGRRASKHKHDFVEIEEVHNLRDDENGFDVELMPAVAQSDELDSAEILSSGRLLDSLAGLSKEMGLVNVLSPSTVGETELNGVGLIVPLPASADQKKGSSSSDSNMVIPASDPIKHKRFVEKLLARSDSNGEVREAWYGKPPTGKEKYTPLESQVVELKAKFPDVVLMVEVGYRYRFFGNDAETAARVLGIFAHYDHNFLTASIPTFRLHVHVRRLVEAGMKVGVVRQTETAAIKAHGSNKTGPFSRGLSALYTRATLEAAEDLGGETEGTVSRLSSYLLCVAERPIVGLKVNPGQKSVADVGSDATAGIGSYDTEIGLVAVETATGDVLFENFRDTVMRSELEGRLLTCSPAELLLATPLSSATEKLLMDFAGPASEVRVERVSRDCFMDGGALAEVVEFYGNKINSESSDGMADEEKVDEGLEAVMAMPEIVVQALALALRYLKQFGLEKLLRLGAMFRPFSSNNEMNLSPNALRQLEIVKNNADGTEKGSLLWLMDHTQTAFGARLLRHWVTHPLCDRTLISARLDAVAEIAESIGSAVQMEGTFPGSGKGGGISGAVSRGSTGSGKGFRQQGSIGGLLSSVGKMPDLERGITRIFHRTATAAEFVSVIQALVTSAKHLQRLVFCNEVDLIVEEKEEERTKGVRSSLLQRLISAVSSEEICEHANRLLSALNTDAAAAGDKLNLFNCTNGRFPEVAKFRVAIKAAEKKLDNYLPDFRKILRLPTLQYISINGTGYLVEAPLAQRVPGDWIKVNSTKKSHRYHPPDVSATMDELALAKEELAGACTRAWDMFLEDFSSHYIDFRSSVQALAALDCLHSLAVVSRNQGYTRPEFVDETEPSQLLIKSGRHPVLDSTLQDGFVPNDTILHAKKERCQIITGPNMGGKSCYIRQVALIAIMAQVGSYVPASSAKLHVFDSVHTRMGASDSLQKGSSTFFEELSEASTIVRSVTCRSLVIVDELGRGTSTHDGVAIAYAALQYLLKEIQCLTLFVTHYPKIAELKKEFPGEVSPYYVSYLALESVPVPERAIATTEKVENRATSGEDIVEGTEEITFLYKLVSGVASKSFGLHVARLAQIPDACVRRAATMAAKLEKEVSDRKKYGRSITTCTINVSDEDVFMKEGSVSSNHREDFSDVEFTRGDIESIETGGSSDSIRKRFYQSHSSCPSNCTDNTCHIEDVSTREVVMETVERNVQDLLLCLKKDLRPDSDPETSLVRLKTIQRQLLTAAS